MTGIRFRRYWINLLVFALAALTGGLCVGALRLSYLGAIAYVHPRRAERPPDDTPARYGIAYDDVELRASDGITLSAWYTPPQNGVLILTAHGYSSRRRPELYALLARHGYGVLAWDFRAQGESGGDLSTLGCLEVYDLEAALDFGLRQVGVRHVGAIGHSMGGVVVIEAAARRSEIEALVADSAFAALEDMLARAMPLAPLRPWMRFAAEREAGVSLDAVRPVDEISRISPRPVFLIHGQADRVVPVEAAYRLYAAAGEPRQLWIVPSLSHARAGLEYPQEYERRLMAFFSAAFDLGQSGGSGAAPVAPAGGVRPR